MATAGAYSGASTGQFGLGSDPSFATALDSLRTVAQLATETIVSATADDASRGGRAAFCAAADVEAACFAVLGGPGEVRADEAAAPAKKGLFSLIPGLGRSEPPKANDTAAASTSAAGAAALPSNAAVASTADGDDTAAADAAAEQRRQWMAAQLSPITDIVILYGDDPLPPGYARIKTSVTGMYPADLNAVSSQFTFSVCVCGSMLPAEAAMADASVCVCAVRIVLRQYARHHSAP